MGKIFTSPKKNLQRTKLKEFHFKLIHRIIVTKKSCIVLALRKMTIVYTVVKKIPSTTLLEIAPPFKSSRRKLLIGLQ